MEALGCCLKVAQSKPLVITLLLNHTSPVIYFHTLWKTGNHRFSEVFRGYRNGT